MDLDSSQDRTTLILELFNRACDLPPAEWTDYLNRVSSDDTSLRHEVEALLRASQQTEEILLEYERPLMAATSNGLTGRLVSHYEILERLGGGGMGEVYKAVDTKLDRIVALKFLPPHLCLDEEAKRRFVKEARAASSLDHTNICTIFDIDETEPMAFGEEARLFIAMAFVEGESLKERIAHGPLPLEDVVEFGSQIADGLSAAHAHGIVHRDVKPANIMLANPTYGGPKSGVVEIVDFGVAKLSNATTTTREGTTMGTIAYMSPEQLMGRETDPRTDIWSLGVVVYEMVTGRQPFYGGRAESCAYSILKEEPEPPTGLRSGVPLAIEKIISKCLQKDPATRYQHMEDLAVDLRAVVRPSGRGQAVLGRESSAGRLPLILTRRGILALGLSLVLVLLISLTIYSSRNSAADYEHPVIRFTVRLPEGEALSYTSTGGSWNLMAISPDGRYIAYTRIRRGEPFKLHLRDLTTLEDHPITGTEQSAGPFFSADGEWLGFVDLKTKPYLIKKVSPRGGVPLTITEGVSGGVSWGPDGTIIFTNSLKANRRELWRTSSDGGTAEQLTKRERLSSKAVEVHHRWPDILPGGKAVLYTATGKGEHWAPATFEAMSIKVFNLETGEYKTLIDPGTFPRYAPTGHLVYAWAGDLLAAPFDLKTLEVTGPPVVVQQNILIGWSGNAHFDFSDNGTLFYIPRDEEQLAPGLPYTVEAVWVDHEGREVAKLPDEIGPLFNVRISPDGTRLSAHKPGRSFAVWNHNLERGTGRPISSIEAHGFYPLWTPDGSGIVYSSSRAGLGMNMVLWKADEDSTVRQLVDRPENQVPQAWAAGGTKIVFTEPRTNDFDILEVGIKGDDVARPLVATTANEMQPVMSPDGRWLAYTSDMTGTNEVFVRRYPDMDHEKQVSTGGGREPLWAPDGKTLYYRIFANMMAVSVQDDGEELRLGEPRRLFEGYYMLDGVRRNYDLSPDGSRFLMVRAMDRSEPPTEFVVVVNWFKELKQIMSGG